MWIRVLLEPERRRVRAKVERAGGRPWEGSRAWRQVPVWEETPAELPRLVRSGDRGPET